MTDDHAYDAVSGSDRFPGVRSPGFDRLRQEGATFENAFVTTSLCSPSRATALTGLYANQSGVKRNNPKNDPDPDVPLVSEMLQDGGYKTAFVGKWHMKPSDEPRRGFDDWYAFKGQGTYTDPVINENGERSTVEGYTTDILTRRAIGWIRENRGADAPFCLFLWHKAPHTPLKPAPRHETLYDDLPIPAPPNWGDTFVDKPAHYRRGAEYGNVFRGWREGEGKPIPDKAPPPHPWISQGQNHKLDRIRTYLETQQAVDEGIERVLDALDAAGLSENTLVVYTSDNGMNLWAHHYTPDKRTAWEESIRVPFVMRWPGTIPKGETIDALTTNADLVPTFLEVAGLERPERLHGRSLAPLWRGEDVEWRDSFLYMYFRENFAPGFPTVLAARGERYKYIHLPNDGEHLDELYDLKNDPYELNNLFADPEHQDTVKRMQARLRGHLRSVDYQQAAPQIDYRP